MRRATRTRSQPSKPRHLFLSTLSLRRATTTTITICIALRFLSTLSLRRATGECQIIIEDGRVFLSTLSLRRATAGPAPLYAGQRYFYPRSPCGERPAGNQHWQILLGDFYPRSPCGERRLMYRHQGQQNPISIHALLAESDKNTPQNKLANMQFLSTLSLRRATASTGATRRAQEANISIHALLAESDPYSLNQSVKSLYFYPRSPCGERPRTPTTVLTLICISIHALLAESDIFALWMVRSHPLFLSTLSLRRAT